MTVETIIADGARALGQTLDAATLARLARYAALVIKWNRVANLTGARRAEDFARKFIVDALAVVPHVGEGRIADLGSGAGLPGMVIAIVRPDLHCALIEPRARRARFLEQARIELALDNVEVHCVRGEDWQPAAPLDAIVCQAVGSLEFLLRTTAALRSSRTRLLALKGHWPSAELEALGADAAACEVIPLTVPGWTARHLVRIDGARLGAGG